MSSGQENTQLKYGLQQAEQAANSYRGYGNFVPPIHELELLVSTMRHGHADPEVRQVRTGAYIDAAKHSGYNLERRTAMISKAIRWSGIVAEGDIAYRQPQTYPELLKCGMYVAYSPKFTAWLEGRTTTIEDETELLKALLSLGRHSLPVGTDGADGRADRAAIAGVRGRQLELSIHLLNARFNLKHGEILQHVWPSLPREENPRDQNVELKTGWNMAFSTETFWDQTTARFIHVAATTDQYRRYHPPVDVIYGRDDLHLATGAEVINTIVTELHHQNKLQREKAKERLDTLEGYLMKCLGWTYDTGD